MDANLKREIIVDNVENPFHRGIKDKENFIKANTHNESCIDNIDLYVKIKDNKIIDAYFEGEACVISISSTNILINLLIGKTRNEGINIIDNYLKITLKSSNESFILSYTFKNIKEQEEFKKTYHLGNEILVKGEATKPKNNSNFNYQKYLERKNIYYLIKVKEYSLISSEQNILIVY